MHKIISTNFETKKIYLYVNKYHTKNTNICSREANFDNFPSCFQKCLNFKLFTYKSECFSFIENI